MRITIKHSIILLIMLMMCIVGCKKSEILETQEQMLNQKAQVLRINNHGNLASLHPHTGIDLQCRIFQKALFEGLTRINPQGVPELAVAESVEISESKTRYTFILRSCKWTNGEEVLAEHFEKTWKAAIAPASNCLRADLFYPIKNAAKAKKGDISLDQVGIYAKDLHTFVVELEHPTPYFLDLVANALFSPLYDDSPAPKIFNGPYHIALWEQDKQMILEKNPHYWDTKNVTIDQIDLSFVADPNTSLMMYEKNELDWIGHPFSNIPPDALPRFEKTEEFHSHPISGVYWICLNTERFPLNSVKIRKSLSIALNRESIAKHVALGETPTRSITPPSISILEESELYPDANPRKAKALFQEGLEELHLKQSDFPVLTLNHSDIPGQKKLAEAIQQTWEKTLGITVELQNAEWNVFFASLGQREYQMGGCIWFSVFSDPIYNLEFFKEQSHRYNAPQWENKHYQKLLEMADFETDLDIRKEHLRQAEQLLLDEMPVIPLYVVHAKYLKSPKVKGLFVSDLGQADFKWASIEQPAIVR